MEKPIYARSIAQMQLELARGRSLRAHRANDGRPHPVERQAEQARVAENEHWGTNAAEIQLQRARLAVLRNTGTLVATLQLRWSLHSRNGCRSRARLL